MSINGGGGQRLASFLCVARDGGLRPITLLPFGELTGRHVFVFTAPRSSRQHKCERIWGTLGRARVPDSLFSVVVNWELRVTP